MTSAPPGTLVTPDRVVCHTLMVGRMEATAIRMFMNCQGSELKYIGKELQGIGLYRDAWIAAIASSRTRLATLTGAMCKTSQCELRSLRVNSGMLNVIRIVTYYTLPPLESPDSFWMAMAFSR